MDSSDRGVSKYRIQGNVGAAPTSPSSHSPNVAGGTDLQVHLGAPPLIAQSRDLAEPIMQEVGAVNLADLVQIPEHIITSTSEAGASSFEDDQATVPHSNEPLPRCDEECVAITSSLPLRKLMDIDPSISTHLADLQNLEGGTNTAGPSSSQALVPPQDGNVRHQCINTKTRNAEENPTVLSSSWKNLLPMCHPEALMNPCIKSSSQAPNNAPPPHIPVCGTGLRGLSSLPELDMNKGARTSHPSGGNNFEEDRDLERKLKLLFVRGAHLRDEVEFAASLSLKKPRMEVVNWLANVEKLRNDFIEAASEDRLPTHQQVDILMQETNDLMGQGKGLFEVRETKVSKLFEGKMVGEAFQRNTKKILKYLAGNQVSRLGIYGMGGVGKTNIMLHVHNRLIEEANYDSVLWITVSQDFNTQKLQDDIWEALGLGTLLVKDVRKRAAVLFDCFSNRRCIVILDDVWECIDLEEVGIPLRECGIKLVLTTRSLNVCCQMQCQAKIKIEPLSPMEAESLFFEELGTEVAFNLKTEALVKSIVRECAGLPLGVITMARSTRGMTNVFEWTDCLEKLRESSMGQTDMGEKVLMNLKFSYNRLGNCEVQQCFLSCALYPEDALIDKFQLIEFFMDQGLIGSLNTREKQYARGLTILSKLVNVCLLEGHGSKIKMHDLIRDMALHIMSGTSIVKAGKGLKRIPLEEYWTDALEKVSLMENDIREFPLNMSPNCPKLSTCLLNRSLLGDVVMPDSFFEKLCGLKVLNLTGCKLRKLPDSISGLVNLRALLLRECGELCCLPHLGNLRSLRKLDICGCVHLEALEGLEMLVNLRYLDLTDTGIKSLAKGTLGVLVNLQYLKVQVVNGDDIAKLWSLETLQCHFNDVDDFNKLVRVIQKSHHRHYRLDVDQEGSLVHLEVGDGAGFENGERIVHIHKWSHAILPLEGESSGICILIPQDVQTLTVTEWDSMTNLSDMGLFKCLESLNIEEWKNLRVFCGQRDEEPTNIHDSAAPTPSPLLFTSLRVLKISQCPKLKYLFGHGSKFFLPLLREIKLHGCEEMVGIIAAFTSPQPWSPPAFPSLEEICVEECDKMKRVLEFEWLPHFRNLKSIVVRLCTKMENIIGGPPPYMLVEDISLRSLEVHHCDNMRRLFTYELLIHLRNLHTIRVDFCKGMVEMISRGEQGQEGSIMTPVNNAPSSFQGSISLPKLKVLWLHDLPQLESIYEVPIICDSVEDIRVLRCPKLKRIPLQLRFRDKDLPSIELEDEEMRKTLTWDPPDAPDILQTLSP